MDPARRRRRRAAPSARPTSRTTITSARRAAPGPDGTRCDGAFLGPAHDDDAIAAFLEQTGARGERLEERVLLDAVAELLAEGKVVGWFQGRMEFGPRALGNRSILGDPRAPDMQRR